MPEYVYRYRSIANLFGKFKELESQTIFFASPDQLNDPIEGFKDVFWSGDEIVWRNLLRHYVLCLDNALTHVRLTPESEAIDSSILSVNAAGKLLRNPAYRPVFEQISAGFLKADSVERLLAYLAVLSRSVGRSELLFHLSMLHRRAFSAMLSVQKGRGYFGDSPTDGPSEEFLREWSAYDYDRVFDIVGAIEQASADADEVERAYAALESVGSQQRLLAELRRASSLGNQKAKLLFLDFPATYLREIEKLVYAGWYTACFSGDGGNSSMWGYYARSHSGVCLMFKPKTEGGRQCLALRNPAGSSNAGLVQDRTFDQVTYDTRYPRIDFFGSIGRLNESDLLEVWYTDENGNRSARYGAIAERREQWRADYRAQSRKIITTKLTDWSYEDEYRIIMSPALADTISLEDRALTYDFSDLAGIIFGIKTSTEDKVRIMRVIRRKCRASGRTDFKFYQAYYSNVTGKVEPVELPQVTF